MSLTVKLTPGEEKFAIEYMAGAEPLQAFRLAFPENRLDDGRARYKAKEILGRERVQTFIEHTRNNGDLTDMINKISIKKYLWDTAQSNKGKMVGLKAALELGKEFGIGVNLIEIKDERRFDDMLKQLHDYNDAKSRGENPQIPSILSGSGNIVDEVDFEIAEFEEVNE